ncbi:pupal cuticle protein Edg-78E-like [Toxorhynchites rutilus septentrionalis]|uniref:pupal cuticle protein Edg-78E-like n=1 Tax=Toxorhynchites rutilus septentrionalis TaxID=329112 RepID=UPI002479663E|nr:pupal cuticle protein Edg-78E-like [Toxorhynchites rutilus septentrionalis]
MTALGEADWLEKHYLRSKLICQNLVSGSKILSSQQNCGANIKEDLIAEQHGSVNLGGEVQQTSGIVQEFCGKMYTVKSIMLRMITFLVVLIVCVAAAPAADDGSAKILTEENILDPEGKFSWKFSTSNGIQAEESGQGGESVEGSASWVGDDGVPIVLTYTADENGFHPQGAHLPTPPPIPDYILKALRYIEARQLQRAADEQK